MQETNYPAVYITSRNGQEFQCLLPQLHEEETSEKEVVNEKDTDVLELLKPMKTGSCLSKVSFCYKNIFKVLSIQKTV